MKPCKIKKSLRHATNILGALGLLTIINPASLAQSTTLGGGIGIGQSPYLGDGSLINPLPLLEYDSKYLFVSGLSAGVHLWQNTEQQLNLELQYLPLSLKPSDNDDARMKLLDRRKSTLLGGLSYSVRGRWGQLKGEVLTDLLDNSRSTLLEADYSYNFQITEELTLTPQVGVIWANRKHNTYYYGVSEKEAQQSGFSAYEAGSGITPHLGLAAHYKITPRWSGLLQYHYLVLNNKVKSSPIVNRSGIHTLSLGIMYHF